MAPAALLVAAAIAAAAPLAATPRQASDPGSLSPSESGSDLEAGPPRDQDSAMVIREGSVAHRHVVALGRDVLVAGEVRSDVAAFDGSVRVTGRVAGDLIVLDGDAHLGPRARVGGDVFVLGGRVEAAPGATIEGRTVAHPTAAAAWLTLLEGPSLGLGAGSPLVLGTKLALMAAWMALTLLLFAASGRQVLATSATVRREPFRCFAVGLTGVLALVLTAVALAALAPPLAGAPLLALVVLFALLLKLWGMVAVFHALGARAATALRRPRPLALNAATAGLLILGLVKFVPHLGAWIWTVATLIGVGASLGSKFGRQEAWFQMAELDRPAPVR
jgi:hypothetical protein